MTRTIRKRDTDHPTRDGNHNPICKDTDNCKDCEVVHTVNSEKHVKNEKKGMYKEWSVLSVIKIVKILVPVVVI